MDLAAIAKHATPGLIDEIAQRYPSFPQQWVDDRTRTLAALFLMEQKHPDVLAVHPNNPAKDLKEFLANAKTTSFTYGSAGPGTGPQIGAVAWDPYD